MAVADLSITTKRMQAVQFSMPWMNIGISIIYMKPKKAPPGLLTFLEPFSNSVWMATAASILLVAIFTFIIGRLVSTLSQDNIYQAYQSPLHLHFCHQKPEPPLCDRFSPYEWFNPNFCVMQPEELETQVM